MIHSVIVASDIHFGAEHGQAVDTFLAFALGLKPRPALMVLAGDIVDLSALSRYDPTSDTPANVVPEIQCAVRWTNRLAARSPVTILSGNHEDRWAKALLGTKAIALRGALGLTLRDQFLAQGMKRDVRWVDERPGVPGLMIGDRALLARHGHVQAGRYSNAKSIPDKLLRQTPTVSTIVGHHHRGGFLANTVLGQTIFGIANPHLSGDHDYCPNANWQRGFSLLEFYGASRLRDCRKFTPHVLIMDERGSFCYGGKQYGK